MSLRLVLFGPPGCGKGTQARFVAYKYGIPAISTGEIFRANILGGTELGILAGKYINGGDMVPDSVVNPMVLERLLKSDCANGFLLDGYPRSVAQAEVLAAFLSEHGLALSAAIEIEVTTDETVRRLLKRAEEQGRADDTEPVIRHRVEVYETTTAPMEAWYRSQGLLREIDGEGDIEQVATRISDVLCPLANCEHLQTDTTRELALEGQSSAQAPQAKLNS